MECSGKYVKTEPRICVLSCIQKVPVWNLGADIFIMKAFHSLL